LTVRSTSAIGSTAPADDPDAADDPAPTATRRWSRRAALISVFLLLTDCTILGDLRLDAGYAAFGSPGIRDTNRHLALSLGPLPLKLASYATYRDAELSTLLGGVWAVRVYEYEVDGDAGRVRRRIDAVRDSLLGDGWAQPVAIRTDDELAFVLVKWAEPGEIRGVAFAAQDDENLILANVMGPIRPETLGALMAELDRRLPGTLTLAAAGTRRASEPIHVRRRRARNRHSRSGSHPAE
jgi:hypothetical protein